MKEIFQSQTRIKVIGFVENWLGKKIWYDYVIRLNEKYIIDDLKGFANWMNAHYPTITSYRLEND